MEELLNKIKILEEENNKLKIELSIRFLFFLFL